MHRSSFSIAKCLILIVSFFLFTGCAALNFKVKADYTDDVVNMDFVFIEGGSFQMGSMENSTERPIHSVKVQGLFVGQYEVTFEQYDQFCEATNHEKPNDEGWGRNNRPVINIDFAEATAFAKWLSDQSEREFRLPSEAEWEYFARAGTNERFWWGDSIDPDKANCSDCNQGSFQNRTAPVASYPPNPWGLYDTLGNVAEWTMDNVKKDYSEAPADGSPESGGNPKRKIIRGGSWANLSPEISVSNRDWENLTTKKSSIGFRLVMSLPGPAGDTQ